jgi:hypothetical protein
MLTDDSLRFQTGADWCPLLGFWAVRQQLGNNPTDSWFPQNDASKFTRPGDAPRPGAPILIPARRLHINNVPGRMNTKKTLANYR